MSDQPSKPVPTPSPAMFARKTAPASKTDEAPSSPGPENSEEQEPTPQTPEGQTSPDAGGQVPAGYWDSHRRASTTVPAESTPTGSTPTGSTPAADVTGTTPATPENAPQQTPPQPKPAAPAPTPPSESGKHGRVDDDGTVYVILADGTERAVGSYPGASAEEALAYFARKYDELAAGADLLSQRLAHTDVSSQDARQSLNSLKEQIGEANVVGDLAALENKVASLEQQVKAKAATEAEQRAAAKEKAGQEREVLVAEAEKLAATDPARMQWKQASARVRELLDEWKAHQRSGPRLDKDVENALWQRFSGARSAFDKVRKTWFAQLDEEHAQAKSIKEKLVKEAEALATSRDWGPTAGAFKRLMQDWKRAGRASRSDDDALWKRFKEAQDSFFNAKDEVVAAEEAEFAENLVVKEALLVEAEALPVDMEHLESTKAELRRIQDKWDVAGKVPRADIRRVEGRLRAVEQAVRDLEDQQWKKSDPELTARAASMVEQLERAVQGLQSDLEAARAAGDEKKIQQVESELAAKSMWLESARGNLN